jgi:DNA polymerase-3 subunit epsilon
VRGDSIDHLDSFEAVLRQDEVSSEENILIHGIAGTEQRAGRDPAEALVAFLEFVGGDPLIAYHAFFDQAMLGRACKSHLGVEMPRAWLDLAYLTPAVLRPGPQETRRGLGLDDWLARFGVVVSERHRAVADAYATAQLWLCLAPTMSAMGMQLSRDVLKLAADYEWLRRSEPRA